MKYDGIYWIGIYKSKRSNVVIPLAKKELFKVGDKLVDSLNNEYIETKYYNSGLKVAVIKEKSNE